MFKKNRLRDKSNIKNVNTNPPKETKSIESVPEESPTGKKEHTWYNMTLEDSMNQFLNPGKAVDFSKTDSPFMDKKVKERLRRGMEASNARARDRAKHMKPQTPEEVLADEQALASLDFSRVANRRRQTNKMKEVVDYTKNLDVFDNPYDDPDFNL